MPFKKSLDTILLEWEVNFNNHGISKEFSDKYLIYIKLLLENKIPIIFDFNHLSKLLGRTNAYLASVVNSSSSHYRNFEIPKKKGGKRKICSPYPALFECQQWIYQNILKKLKIHRAAHAFCKNKSIVSNTKFHCNQKFLLKIDLKDFFTSIKINRIINIFKDLGYPNIVSFYLAQICCYNDYLPQGAPTSPVLSNLVAKNLDKRCLNLAKKLNLKYTRYADDIAFSGDYISSKFLDFVKKIIIEEGFEINEEKTIFYYKKGKRILTGLSVSGKEIKIPREYKRKLRQEVHYIIEYGLFSHTSKLKIRNPFYLDSIIGKLQFWILIEPNNTFAEKSLLKLIDLNKKLNN